MSGWPVKIGQPYRVRGVTYVPAAAPGYEAVGYASWYRSGSGNRTANGERYRAHWVSGAHTTLPLPSYVEVTALDSGRTILMRVNDRGPFARDRVLDLSRGAARLLGVERAGQAAVHVRLVDPPGRGCGPASPPRRGAMPRRNSWQRGGRCWRRSEGAAPAQVDASHSGVSPSGRTAAGRSRARSRGNSAYYRDKPGALPLADAGTPARAASLQEECSRAIAWLWMTHDRTRHVCM